MNKITARQCLYTSNMVYKPLESLGSVNQFISVFFLIRLRAVVPIEIVQAYHEGEQHLQ